MHSRDAAYLQAKGYIKIVKDTTGLENDEVENADLDKLKKQAPKKQPAQDTVKTNAVLPGEKRKPAVADSTKN